MNFLWPEQPPAEPWQFAYLGCILIGTTMLVFSLYVPYLADHPRPKHHPLILLVSGFGMLLWFPQTGAPIAALTLVVVCALGAPGGAIAIAMLWMIACWTLTTLSIFPLPPKMPKGA